MMLTAWLEPMVAVLRIGEHGAKHYDPYHFSTTIRFLSIDEVEVVGVCKTITGDDWRAMIECFKDNGVKRILFKRIKNGGTRERWLTCK